MGALKLLIVSGAVIAWAFSAYAASLTPEEAPGHIGENATVCGMVVSGMYAAQSRGQPTFLNFGKPYPNQPFTAVIWGSDRSKFGMPETSLRGKQVCVTGQIRLYRGKAEVILSDPNQVGE
jgi:DNA/RNA endonuclease YhcR with UshA esterase domain